MTIELTEFKFETKGDEIELDIITDFKDSSGKVLEFDSQPEICTSIKWRLEIDIRDWGVKEIHPYIEDQTILISGVIINEKGLQEEVEIPIKLSHENVGYEYEGVKFGFGLNNLEYYNGEWTVGFVS